MLVKHFLPFIFLFFSVCGRSQSVALVPTLGVMGYEGDMAEIFVNPRELHVAGGVGLRYHLNKAFALKPQVLIGKISGDDGHSIRNFRRQLRFEAQVFEAAVFLEYNLFHPHSKRYYGQVAAPRLSCYLSGGIGFTLADAFVHTENAPVEAFKVPFPEPDDKAFFTTAIGGLSLLYRLTDRVGLGMQGSLHYVFSDYLDGLSQNGDPAFNDWNIYLGLSLSVQLGEEVQCPGF